MAKSIGIFVGVVAVVVLITVGISVYRSQPQDGAPQVVPLTAETQAAVGAAAKVPADVAYYMGLHDLGPRLRAAWQSNAMQKIVQLPVVQSAWWEWQENTDFQQVMQMLRTHPLAVELLPILQDGASREIFVAVGADMVDFAGALTDVVNKIQLANVRDAIQGHGAADAQPDAGVIIDAVLEHADALQTPSILIGMKVSDAQSAREFLSRWLAEFAPMPRVRVEKQSIGGADFYALKLTGENLPATTVWELTDALEQEGVSMADRERLTAFVHTRRLFVAVGVLDDYLLLSIGKDEGLLNNWGAEASLAASVAFAPLRQQLSAPLLSITYASDRMAYHSATKPKDLQNIFESVIEALPDDELPPGLKTRLLGDVKELAAALPEPAMTPMLSFMQVNRGLEMFHYLPQSGPVLDDSQPLEILAHRGQTPLAWSAARLASNPGAYDTLAQWLVKAFGYFEDYAVPEMSPDEKLEYHRAMEVVRPFLASIHKTNRENLVPALDGTPSLLLFDGGGRLDDIPDMGRLTPAVPMPRLGIAIQLNDAARFLTAIQQHTQATNTLLAGLAERFPDDVPGGIALPAPLVADRVGGRYYFYPLPMDFGPDGTPGALLKDNLLILATSARLAEDMVGKTEMPTDAVIALNQPAGSAAFVNVAESAVLIHRMFNAVRVNLISQGELHPEQQRPMMMIEMHLQAVTEALGAVRTYSSRWSVEGDRMVGHAWLHLEDIAP